MPDLYFPSRVVANMGASLDHDPPFLGLDGRHDADDAECIVEDVEMTSHSTEMLAAADDNRERTGIAEEDRRHVMPLAGVCSGVAGQDEN